MRSQIREAYDEFIKVKPEVRFKIINKDVDNLPTNDPNEHDYFVYLIV